jgi:DNA-binding response OmpR family regulator
MTSTTVDSDRAAMLARLRRCTILLVDDEEANLDLLEAVLAEAGFTSLVRVDDAREVMSTMTRVRPDLVLLDLHMPHRHGLEVLHDLRVATPPDEYLPILVLTADVTADAKEHALRAGARDFLTKPFDTVEVILRVENLLETRTLHGDQRAARQRAEYAERRAALLAEWSRRLALSLDATTALSQLPSLVVPTWCDGCAVVGGDPAAPIVGELQGEGAVLDRASLVGLSERMGATSTVLQLPD